MATTDTAKAQLEQEAADAEAAGEDLNEGEDAPAGGGGGTEGEETVLEPNPAA